MRVARPAPAEPWPALADPQSRHPSVPATRVEHREAVIGSQDFRVVGNKSNALGRPFPVLLKVLQWPTQFGSVERYSSPQAGSRYEYEARGRSGRVQRGGPPGVVRSG